MVNSWYLEILKGKPTSGIGKLVNSIELLIATREFAYQRNGTLLNPPRSLHADGIT
jgi:hypothetical protein